MTSLQCCDSLRSPTILPVAALSDVLREMQSSNIKLQEKLESLEKKFDEFQTSSSTSQPRKRKKKLPPPPPEVRVSVIPIHAVILKYYMIYM